MSIRLSAFVTACVLALPLPTAAQEVAAVEVTPAQRSVVAGATAQFRAVARDATGRSIPNAEVHWLATPFDIAGADANGLVTTTRAGRVYVLAFVGGTPGLAVLDIRERAPARLAVSSPGGAETVVGGNLQLEAIGETELGDPVPAFGVRWRSLDPKVAEVGALGLVTGRAAGTARIEAALEGLSARVEVAVKPNPVREVVIAAPAEPVRTGDAVRLTAEARDARGRAVRGIPVRWSVSGEGATVTADWFVAGRPGAYRVTASVASAAAAATIQVVPRSDPRGLELVARAPLPKDVQAGEIWPVGDVAYVSSIGPAVYVFDISNPAAPVLTDSIVVDARLVNDVSTTADGRIGVLTREGASTRRNGLVFFEAADPRHPKVISEFTEGLTGGVHSAFIYGHHVFATDDATGSLRIVDFSDPRSPRQVARWEIPREGVTAYAVEWLNIAPQRYLHDVYVEDGLAYLAYWRDGLVILDVGNGIVGGSITSPKPVSRFTYNHAELYPPGFIAGSHAVFRRGRYVFVADESYPGTSDITSREAFPTRGLVHAIDVSDLRNPRKVAQYDPVEFGAHNLWVEGDLLYVGAYDGGIRVIDVSGELRGELRDSGRVIGSLYTGTLDGYRPNQALVWSAIPHKGFVFASDLNTGLWVARVVGQPLVP